MSVPAYPGRVLRVGSHGPAVVTLQHRLKVRPNRFKRFGPITRRHVRNAQKKFGIQVDGQVGPETWGRLFPQPAQHGRAAALGWARAHLGHTEHPYGSNRDPGPDSITAWATKAGFPGGGVAWCGIYCFNALRAAGVAITSRVASVALAEDDARAGRYGFRGYTTNGDDARPGDLAVMFGRGVHIVIVEEVHPTYLSTLEGNTGPGPGGSQSNGGGSYRRVRPRYSVHGYCLVAYPS